MTLSDGSDLNLRIIIKFGPSFPHISRYLCKVERLESRIGIEFEVARIFIDVIFFKGTGRCTCRVWIWLDVSIRHDDDSSELSRLLHKQNYSCEYVVVAESAGVLCFVACRSRLGKA